MAGVAAFFAEPPIVPALVGFGIAAAAGLLGAFAGGKERGLRAAGGVVGALGVLALAFTLLLMQSA